MKLRKQLYHFDWRRLKENRFGEGSVLRILDIYSFPHQDLDHLAVTENVEVGVLIYVGKSSAIQLSTCKRLDNVCLQSVMTRVIFVKGFSEVFRNGSFEALGQQPQDT